MSFGSTLRKARLPVSSSISIPPVPVSSRPSAPTTRAAAPISSAPRPVAKKSGSGNRVVLAILVGIVLLGAIVLSQGKDGDDGAAPKPTASESMSEEPTAEPSESATDEPTNMTYEAPQSFVAINNGNGGVTLRWKAPATTDGLKGYAISLSYDAKNFTEAVTVGADQFTFDVAMAGDEGGTQFLLQAVYEDGTKVDAKKFSLKGKYQN